MQPSAKAIEDPSGVSVGGLASADRQNPVGRPDGVSLVIPAYNEADCIQGAIRSYLSPLAKSGVPYEVIVVADGSDATPDAVRAMGDPSVRVLEYDRRLGKGGAVIEGFKASRFARVGYTDADGSLHPDSLTSLIELSAQYDCVFGSRWIPGSVWLAREPRSREVAGRVFNVLIRMTLGLDTHDTQCGAKFYSAAFLDRLLPSVYVNNETTDVSFIFHAKRLGGKVIETPVVWTNREASRYRLIHTTMYNFLTIVGMRIANSPTGRRVPRHVFATLRQVVENV